MLVVNGTQKMGKYRDYKKDGKQEDKKEMIYLTNPRKEPPPSKGDPPALAQCT